jgi:hypothetical protein
MKGTKMDLSKIEQSVKLMEEAEASYKKALEEAIAPGLDYIAKTYGEQIQSIHIIAYTPVFNDGEPCEHSSDWGVGYGWLENYGMEDLMKDWFEDEEERIEELMNAEINVPAEVNNFISKVLDPYFESKLHTNYQAHIRFEDGSYILEEDEHDCGY